MRCACGCGSETGVYKYTDKRSGIKGQPKKYLAGHQQKVKFKQPTPELCQCGCGQYTTVYHGIIRRFITGHNGRMADPPDVRFWNKVDKSAGEGSCWNWIAYKKRDGYGWFGVHRKELILAHRYSWVLSHGAIPAGMNVLHKCDNPACVNPNHLWLGTLADNNKDMCRKGRYVGFKSLICRSRRWPSDQHKSL